VPYITKISLCNIYAYVQFSKNSTKKGHGNPACRVNRIPELSFSMGKPGRSFAIFFQNKKTQIPDDTDFAKTG